MQNGWECKGDNKSLIYYLPYPSYIAHCVHAFIVIIHPFQNKVDPELMDSYLQITDTTQYIPCMGFIDQSGMLFSGQILLIKFNPTTF